MDVTRVSIRPAEPEEAPALTELAMRSKASHGYDEQFMARAASELAVSHDYIADHSVFVVDDGGTIGGFYGLTIEPPVGELDLFFVEPGAHGKGYGRLLLTHACEEARALGCTHITIQSDPYAVAFYEALGAKRIGESVSPSTGRMLPVLRLDL